MTTGDKSKRFILFVPLFTLPTQQDSVLPVADVIRSLFELLSPQRANDRKTIGSENQSKCENNLGYYMMQIRLPLYIKKHGVGNPKR